MRRRARWASSSSAPYDDPDALGQLAAGAAVVTYEFENVPVEAARAVAPLPPPLALELGQDRLVEKQLFAAPRHPDGPVRLARRLGAAGARQVAAARLRRARAAPGGARRGARRARAGRGDRAVRPRAVDHRRPRPRRRDALLAARRERASRRHPAQLAVAGRRRTAGGGRGARRPAPRGARLRRRARARAVRGRRQAARQRVRAARPQHGPLDDRRSGHEPVRESPAGDPRPAARVDRRASPPP